MNCDVGYRRTTQHPSGKPVTIYDIHNKLDVDRKVVAKTWDPGD